MARREARDDGALACACLVPPDACRPWDACGAACARACGTDADSRTARTSPISLVTLTAEQVATLDGELEARRPQIGAGCSPRSRRPRTSLRSPSKLMRRTCSSAGSSTQGHRRRCVDRGQMTTRCVSKSASPKAIPDAVVARIITSRRRRGRLLRRDPRCHDDAGQTHRRRAVAGRSNPRGGFAATDALVGGIVAVAFASLMLGRSPRP